MPDKRLIRACQSLKLIDKCQLTWDGNKRAEAEKEISIRHHVTKGQPQIRETERKRKRVGDVDWYFKMPSLLCYYLILKQVNTLINLLCCILSVFWLIGCVFLLGFVYKQSNVINLYNHNQIGTERNQVCLCLCVVVFKLGPIVWWLLACYCHGLVVGARPTIHHQRPVSSSWRKPVESMIIIGGHRCLCQI